MNGDYTRWVREIIYRIGINQLLFIAAEVIGQRADDVEADSATASALRELALGVEVLAIRAQRAGL